MKWFLDMRTMVKLGMSFAVMAVALAVLGSVTLSVAAESNAALEVTYRRDMAAIDIAGRAQVARLTVAKSFRQAMLETDDSARAAHMRDVDAAVAAYAHFSDELDTMTIFPVEQARLADARRWMVEYGAAAHLAVQTYVHDPKKGEVLLAAAGAKGEAIGAVLQQYVDTKRSMAEDSYKHSTAQYSRGRATAIALILGTMAFAVLLAFVVGGAIAKPLESAVEVLGRVSRGDLTARLELDRDDELGKMAKALNGSLESIAATMRTVQATATEVSAVSTQLSASAQQISAGSQEQAASLEETAASLEEISSTVKQNTDNAQHAAQLASGARDAAERGGQVVGTAVSAMNEITKSSKKIADIITTIDEIAFQTNLLALNAAVEAARAGEQGRGFGVVAAEVRSLAQRTGAAAKEIRGLIRDSSSKVEVGTQQVNESGKTLDEIVRAVKRVTDMVAEIAAASREQNTGIEQVNTAVTQVDQVTQLNAAQTEELSATATSLSEKSVELQGLVSAFQLGDDVRGRPSPAAARTASRAAPPARLRAVQPTSSVRKALPPLKAAGGYEEF